MYEIEVTKCFIFKLTIGWQDLFGVHGAIKSVKIVRDPTTNVRKGYGFVKYSRAEDASAAIAALNGFPVADKKVSLLLHCQGSESGAS